MSGFISLCNYQSFLATTYVNFKLKGFFELTLTFTLRQPDVRVAALADFDSIDFN